MPEETTTTPFSLEHPIVMKTVSAPTNIACIKYWGKADVSLNTPINSSVSVTLNQSRLRAVTTAASSPSFTRHRLWLNGVEEENVGSSARFLACVEGVRALARDPSRWADAPFVHVSSHNTFPTAAGLASSAAGYAALVYALAKLFDAVETYDGQLSTIARRGSGSACRSLHGGFVAWRAGGAADDGSDSLAEQVCDENHWPEIRALILVVSDAKKDTSSTAGMTTSVRTSELLGFRAREVVHKRMAIIEKAYMERDFATFANTTMADSNQFHATCLDTFPPIFYMNDVSRSVIRVIHAYNDHVGEVRAGYTFDAGPNAVVYTLKQYATELAALLLAFYPADADDDDYLVADDDDAKAEAASFELDPKLVQAVATAGRVASKTGDVKKIYYTSSGPGPRVLGEEEATIDPNTGLNTYQRP